MKGQRHVVVAALQLIAWLCGVASVQPVLGVGGRLSIGSPAGTIAGRSGVEGEVYKLYSRPEAQLQHLHRQTSVQASPSSNQSQEDLIRVHELSSSDTAAVRWTGVRSANDLAPESRVVAIYFDQPFANHTKMALAYRPDVSPPVFTTTTTNKTKQSQEFDTHQNQNQNQQQQLATSSTERPPTEVSTSLPLSTQPSTTGSSTPSQVTAVSTTPPGWPALPEQPSPSTTATSTTTPTAPIGVSSTESPPPQLPGVVGAGVDREGDAVLCGEANANGKSNKTLNRIVGGHKTEPGEFPFQVRLNIRSRRGSGICGGVVLDTRHVLTAAHCMTACVSHQLTTATIESSGVKVTVGDHSIKADDGELELDAETILPHEKYDACNFYANDHDIAIIKTATPIPFKFTTDGYGSVNRPCLPPNSEVQYSDGEWVIVSGWGVTRENSGSLSNILRYVQVPVVNVTRCQETYGSRVTQDHVCAGFQAGGKDSCQGDSGGPLVRVVENRYELVGIVSFGYGCGQAGAAGVYTKVASYLDWIKTNTKEV